MTMGESQWSQEHPPGSPSLAPYKSLAERVRETLDKSAERRKRNRAMKERKGKLTPEEKRQRAKDLREQADALERM